MKRDRKKKPDAFDFMASRVMEHMIDVLELLENVKHGPFQAGGQMAIEELYCRISNGAYIDWDARKAELLAGRDRARAAKSCPRIVEGK